MFRTLEIIATTLVRVQGLELRYSGIDNIPGRRSDGAVLAINHTGYVDFIPAALGVYRAGRRTRFMIKSEVMSIGIMRFLVNRTGTVAVDRSAGAQAYRAAVDSLRSGEVVAVYPEATISRSFELKDFKTGAVRMAAESGVPIVPVIVWGAQRQWTKGGIRRMGRSKIPVSVTFGPPITVAGDADAAAETARLREVMYRMLLDAQEGYGPHPAGELWVPARLGGSAPTRAEAAELEEAEARRRAEAKAQKAARPARPWWRHKLGR